MFVVYDKGSDDSVGTEVGVAFLLPEGESSTLMPLHVTGVTGMDSGGFEAGTLLMEVASFSPALELDRTKPALGGGDMDVSDGRGLVA